MTGAYGGDVVVAQVLVSVWLLAWAIRSLARLSRGDRQTVLFVQLIFFFFFAVPQLLDLLLGAPVFDYQVGFKLAQFDTTTNLVYLAYIAAVPPMLSWFGGRARAQSQLAHLGEMQLAPWIRVASWGGLLLLPLAIVFAPAPEAYLRYATIVGEQASGYESYHPVVTLSATLAVIAAVLLITTRVTRPVERLLVSPFLVVALWVHGKRSVVALALLLLLYLLWLRGTLRGWRFIAAATAVTFAIGSFSYLYQTQVRRIGETAHRRESIQESDIYVNYRIDFGRDAITKQTIFAELNPAQLKVLDHRGQSLLFHATFFVPRRLWPDKPYPYAVYATAAMLRIPPRQLGWGVTTSWLEEAISNLGWLGLLVGPLVPALICAIGDRRDSQYVGLLTITVASLLLLVEATAFMPLLVLWAVLVIRRPRR